MDLVFAPGFTTDTFCNDVERLRLPYNRPVSTLVPFRKDWVARARQIAAENAAWWSIKADEHKKLMFEPLGSDVETRAIERFKRAGKQQGKFRIQTGLEMSRKFSFARKMAAKWMNIYRQGQLYARDTVRAARGEVIENAVIVPLKWES